MNIYDTANTLASEIRQSEEYMNYKMAKQALELNTDLKNRIKEFQELRYEIQMTSIQNGQTEEEKYKKLQDLYTELIEISETKKYLEAEMKFNVLIADVNKIIGDAIKDVLN